MDQEPNETVSGVAVRPQLHPSEQDGDPRWRITLPVMWVAQLCAIMGFSFVMPFIPFFVRELGVSERMVPIWAGLTTTGSGIAMAIMSPIWGYVADRRGRKLMVQRAMFGGAIALGLIGFSRNIWDLLILRTLQGAVTGTVSACIALVSSVVPRNRLGFSLGLMQMAVFMGGSVGPYLGGLIADRYGYRTPFGVTAGLLLTGGVMVLFGAHERFTPPETEREALPIRARRLLGEPAVLGLLGVYFIMNVANSFVGPIFPLFVEQIIGEKESAATETGVLLAVAGIASAFSAVAIGRLSDQIGHKRVLVFCTMLSGMLVVPHFFANSLNQLLALRLVFGLAAGGMMPAMNALVASLVPRNSIGQAYGFTATASALGWAIGPAFGGLAASAFGYRWPFVFMGGLLLLVGLAQVKWITIGKKNEEL